MKFKYLRICTLIFLLSASLRTNVCFLRSNGWFYRAGRVPDEVSAYEARFETLQKDLSPDLVVGYVDDQFRPEGSPLPGSFEFKDPRRFFLAGYVLTPSLVTYGTGGEYVVGNFARPEAASAVLADSGLVLIKNYGDGLMLLRPKK